MRGVWKAYLDNPPRFSYYHLLYVRSFHFHVDELAVELSY